MLLLCLLLLQLTAIVLPSGVKCFCDRESCDENLLCQGEYCFIGLRREGDGDAPRLRQHCGSGSELPFHGGSHPRCEERIDDWHEICVCNVDLCNTFSFLRTSIDSRAHSQDIVSFTKQDVIPVQRAEPPPARTNSNLVVLLVIIPLAVGGFAVCLIFLNYHCKMC